MEPSDEVAAVASTGTGDIALGVFSMSAASPDGRDDEYVSWHLLDHLPEQHRLAGLRWGQRWRSTPAGRAARAAGAEPFDAVDHVVGYLFAEPIEPALDAFFALGAALHEAGRMPIRLPGVHLARWVPDERAAHPRVLVGRDVLPFRPHRGVYLIVDGTRPAPTDRRSLLDVDGVAGYWSYRGADAGGRRMASASGLGLTVVYLDDDPTVVAAALAPVVTGIWSPPDLLLAAPFELATVPR